MISLILARGGSKKIPNKNIKLLGEKPLICHVLDAAKQTRNINEIYVSSDSEEILEISKNNGAKIIKRPDSLSQDLSKDIDAFIHALDFLKNKNDIIQLRATTPLINSNTLDIAINFYKENHNNCTSMRSVHQTSESVLKYYRKDGLFLKTICENTELNEYSELPRQIVPATYCPNGYIDILKVSTFKNKINFYGDKILSFETEFTPEVDTQEDFDYIEYLYLKRKKNV